MRNISVLYDGSHYTFRWLKALMWARTQFREAGWQLDFAGPRQYLPLKQSRDPSSGPMGKKSFDVVFVAHHHSHEYGIGGWPRDRLFEALDDLKARCNLLVWLDTADSTGTCRFEVLPHVDFYFKKQVLKDVKRYQSPIWGGRVYCDYYHSRHGVEDSEISDHEYQVLDEAYVDKIRVSWNVGLGDLFSTNKYLSYLAGMRQPAFISPRTFRTLDVHFRGSAWSSAAGWQRSRARELLSQRRDLTHPELDTKVSYGEYMREIHQSRVVVSPFGWGEICTRDFESMVSGAVLLKPTVDHMRTFPDWFRAEETYVPVQWDFADFYDKLDMVLGDDRYRLDIATAAQANYEKFRIGEAGKTELVHHLLTNLGFP